MTNKTIETAEPISAKSDSEKFEPSESVNIEETFWGYVVGPGQRAILRADKGEGLAAICSMVFLILAFALWLAPGVQTTPVVLSFKIAITVVFFVLAAKLYLMAKRGFLSEVQVDLNENELRVVRRNRGNESVTLESYKFREIGTVYVERASGAFMLHHLYVKPIRSNRPVLVASGPERVLAEMRQKLRGEIRPRGVTERPEPLAALAQRVTSRPVRTAFASR
jgi:hypothetical protein